MSETKRCPWCAEEIRAEAIKCRHCGSFVEPRAMRSLAAPWARPEQGRMLAGVCAGLAEQFAISVTVLRIAFVLGFFFSAGVVLLLYIALWVAMPSRESFGTSEPPRGRLAFRSAEEEGSRVQGGDAGGRETAPCDERGRDERASRSSS